MTKNLRSFHKAFTLIELLIVVAIIAILAAIAVPNFLEAQTRAKVSRSLADMRTIRVGLESYRVDTNKYPETDMGVAAAIAPTYFRLTTPIAYLTSIPISPFKEQYGGTKHASEINGYLYVGELDRFEAQGANNDYARDRVAYVEQQFGGGAVSPSRLAEARRKGFWLLKSVGPDNLDDRSAPPVGFELGARLYDPTNGTVSRGDIVIFSDRPGTGKL